MRCAGGVRGACAWLWLSEERGVVGDGERERLREDGESDILTVSRNIISDSKLAINDNDVKRNDLDGRVRAVRGDPGAA